MTDADQKPAAKTVMLAAGGTGGHLFPAEALAAELLKRGHRVVIVTDKRGHAFKSLGERAAIHTVRAGTLRAGLVNKIKAVIDMGVGITQSLVLIGRGRPALVVGFGGYPSFPGAFAAQLLCVPTMLHEQNAVLGKANRWLENRAKTIALSLPGTTGIRQRNMDKCVVTGNPVRAGIIAARDEPYAPPGETFNIFVTGGSQAAKVFGDVLPAACGRLPAELRRRLRIVHQCREDAVADTESYYQAAGVTAEIKPFFSDMPERLTACQLFIGRAGASTVAEIGTVGRPAIFVPYPGHADMQQKYNAETIATKGGAWVVMQEDFTPMAMAQKLEELMNDPAGLAQAAQAAKSCGRPDAARKLADLVERAVCV
ncbi:MAG: undecaprenyldiphospho-muramoylpentapeptide beta-N-acetylglucosaminyltransferase [Alphaproteobacteria bacterium]|nr:undecaprenyldiphospho-muramoylpentapeptide beta-N-acetylglucosaminyltransferase [Alphaproteobacteria bacterium]